MTQQRSHLFAYGFRPFFFFGALFGVLSVPLWLLRYKVGVGLPGHLASWQWHAHEMLFGYVGAIVVGFLLTAVPNWTKTTRVHGRNLILLVALWLLGRILVPLWGVAPVGLIATVDAVFYPVVGLVIAVPIIKKKRWRNLGFPPLLVGFGVANLLIHLHVAGITTYSAATAQRVAAICVVLMIVIVGGRIVPAFTRNGLKIAVRDRDRRDDLAVWTVAALIPLEAVPGGDTVTGIVALVAGVLVVARMAGWQTRATISKPILWILHVGYLWAGVGLLLEGVTWLWPEVVGRHLALHAMTVGAMGTFTLAMMTRVALGHTGRPLKAGRAVVWAYVAMILAGLSRAVIPLGNANLRDSGLYLGGALWVLALVLYLVTYTKILFSPRPDGKPG